MIDDPEDDAWQELERKQNKRNIKDDDDVHEYKRPWVSLTNKELFDLWEGWLSDTEYARIVEAKLKEKNGF